MPCKRKAAAAAKEQKEKAVKVEEDSTASGTTDEIVSDHWCGFRDEKDISTFEYHGLICAAHTAFKQNGELDLSTIPKQMDRLIKNGVYAAFVCGTMGESVSMTVEERNKVIDAWMQAAKGKDFTVFDHIGSECLYDTIALAKHAVEAGAKAIALIPPTFFKPSDIDSLVDWLAKVSESCPKTPLYYYHFVEMTGTAFPTQKLLEAAHKKVPTLCGMKYTNYNLFELERCLNLDHKYSMLLGREDTFLGGLAIGVEGGIGATFSLIGHEFSLVLKYFKEGNLKEAMAHQKKANDFAAIIYYNGGKYGPGVGSIELLKVVMKLTGCDVGYARLPRKQLTKAAEKMLKDDLTKIGFFDWCDKEYIITKSEKKRIRLISNLYFRFYQFSILKMAIHINQHSVVANFLIFTFIMLTVPLVTFYVTYNFITPHTSIEEKSRLGFSGVIAMVACIIIIGIYSILAFQEENDLIAEKLASSLSDESDENEDEKFKVD